MSARTLPPRPSLQHLKNEAKQLHHAIVAGDPDAAARAHANLRRLADGDAVDDVTLQESQHILGREYGFHDWQGLAVAADLTFDDLATLPDESLRWVLRRVEKPLVLALTGAPDEVRRCTLGCLDDGVRQFVSGELASSGTAPEHEVTEAREQILHQVRLAATTGAIDWPPGIETTCRNEPTVAAAAGRSLHEMSPEEVRRFVASLSKQQMAQGAKSFSSTADEAVDGFVREALLIAADGTSPELLEDILHNRARAMLQRFHNRLLMTIEACASLRSQDTPRIVEHKLRSIYNADFNADVARDLPAPGHTVAELREHLRKRRLTPLDLDGFTSVCVHLAEITWRRGGAALAEVVDDLAQDRFAQTGVRLVVEDVSIDELVGELEAQMAPTLEEYGLRYHLFTAGIVAVQAGRTGSDLEAAMDEDGARRQTMTWQRA